MKPKPSNPRGSRTKKKAKASVIKAVRNPIRIDPTRTVTIRRALQTELRKRFSRLKAAIVKLVIDEDAFGLKERKPLAFNAFCPTGIGGGVDPSCSPGQGAGAGSKERLGSNFDRAVESSSRLSPEQKQEYKSSLRAVVQKMTPTASSRVEAAIKQVSLHPDLHSLTSSLAENSPKVREVLARGKVAGGAFNAATGRLTLDGGGLIMESASGASKATTAGLHSHELGHALDLGANKDWSKAISSKPEWHDAWQKELTSGRISKYAAANPREGFAEFSRLVHATKLTPEQVAHHFPACAAVWKKEGIL